MLKWLRSVLAPTPKALIPAQAIAVQQRHAAPENQPTGQADLPVLDAEEGRQSQLASFRQSRVRAGIQWSATLSLNTPLRSLERHDEVFRGDPESAPMYGTPGEGTWVPVVEWERVGLRGPEEGTMWSVIGQIPTSGGDFLPFLLSFRRIVESDRPVPEQLEDIEALCESTAEFRQIARRIAESTDAGQRIGGRDFAKKFFAQPFEAVPGVGAAIALRLFDAGIHTLNDLAAASDEQLWQIPGVGPGLVKKLRAYAAAAAH